MERSPHQTKISSLRTRIVVLVFMFGTMVCALPDSPSSNSANETNFILRVFHWNRTHLAAIFLPLNSMIDIFRIWAMYAYGVDGIYSIDSAEVTFKNQTKEFYMFKITNNYIFPFKEDVFHAEIDLIPDLNQNSHQCLKESVLKYSLRKFKFDPLNPPVFIQLKRKWAKVSAPGQGAPRAPILMSEDLIAEKSVTREDL